MGVKNIKHLMIAVMYTAIGAAQVATGQPVDGPAEKRVPPQHQYLSQDRPALAPEVFARSFFPEYIHTTPVFSKDLSEMYWSKDEKIYRVRYESGKWSVPVELNFSKRGFVCADPFLSPAGDTLFFMVHQRPVPGVRPDKENIWTSKRLAGGRWSDPAAMSPIINRHHMHWQLSVAKNGNLYFIAEYTKQSPIYMSKFENGAYQEPVKLGRNINDAHQRQQGPYIAPDESFLLFSRAPDTRGSGSLFISFNDGGRWTPARQVRLKSGRILRGISPIVSPDQKYLFYMGWTNREHRAFWVDARANGILVPTK